MRERERERERERKWARFGNSPVKLRMQEHNVV
jgi:hypothetical protein